MNETEERKGERGVKLQICRIPLRRLQKSLSFIPLKRNLSALYPWLTPRLCPPRHSWKIQFSAHLFCMIVQSTSDTSTRSGCLGRTQLCDFLSNHPWRHWIKIHACHVLCPEIIDLAGWCQGFDLLRMPTPASYIQLLNPLFRKWDTVKYVNGLLWLKS